MATKIDTVTSRDKLKLRREPYWHRIAKGAYLGYRKMIPGPGGPWSARVMDPATGREKYKALGVFAEIPDHQRFDAASRAAAEWFTHLGQGGSTEEVTVQKACENYVAYLRDGKTDHAANDAAGRFKRWIYPNLKLAGTPMQKLVEPQVAAWRKTLSATKAMHQDKKKESTRDRTRSALNRDMATLRAAFNLALRNRHSTNDYAWKEALRGIRGATGRRDVYLDIGQRRALIAAAPPALAGLLRGLSLLPLRPGALAKLVAGNFDKRLSTLVIGEDKAGQDRRIQLPPATAAFFAAQSAGKLPGAPLLAQASGKPWDKDAWKDPFKAAAAAAGLPPAATAYALRHSTITDLIALHHLDTLTVAQLSGTSLQMIEQHYGHLLRQHAANALALLAV